MHTQTMTVRKSQSHIAPSLPPHGLNGTADTIEFMGAVMPKGIEPEAFAEYRRCFDNPATIHATCEDYRAGASIDLTHDEADMTAKIGCPVLVLWGANGLVGRKYDVVSVWRARAGNVSGKALPGGHWLAEELPEQTLAEIKTFLLA